jgi:tetratricopeptide (TPR) repeat protein
MSQPLIKLLQELKKEFKGEVMKEIFECLESSSSDFIENEQLVDLLNSQKEEFYKELALAYTKDLNDFSLMHFIFWEPFITVFDDDVRNEFWKLCLKNSKGTDASNYINGFVELEINENPKLALEHFDKIEHYMASYFIGLCQFHLGKSGNAIEEYEIFLHELDEVLATLDLETKAQSETDLIVYKWDIYLDLALLYNEVGDFEKAKSNAEKSLELFNLDENFELNHDADLEGDEKSDFEVFIDNYISSLEKVGDTKKCLDVLNFVIEKMPSNKEYLSKKSALVDRSNLN